MDNAPIVAMMLLSFIIVPTTITMTLGAMLWEGWNETPRSMSTRTTFIFIGTLPTHIAIVAIILAPVATMLIGGGE